MKDACWTGETITGGERTLERKEVRCCKSCGSWFTKGVSYRKMKSEFKGAFIVITKYCELLNVKYLQIYSEFHSHQGHIFSFEVNCK